MKTYVGRLCVEGIAYIMLRDRTHSLQPLRSDQTQSNNERTFQWALYFYYVTVLWSHKASQVQLRVWAYIPRHLNKLLLLLWKCFFIAFIEDGIKIRLDKIEMILYFLNLLIFCPELFT